ncbi:MAG TPA: formate hydrogenlyase [Gammaproteobacteria bacterium]|nr:formate hydrogenlyase [Gammaproteobacteria bacterium]
MNAVPSALLLILVPLLPLLLAFPALRSRLPWPRHIALLPAVVLLILPASISIELPWLLLGTGLGIDGTGRLFLAMSVLIWIAAATLLHTVKGKTIDERFTTFFLLTLAGNLGAILATELVGFFAFLVLMGYAFYGLLVAGVDERTRRAARLYLVLLILSDLALFEALLIAASMTGDLGFEVVRQAMAQSPSSALYMSMVLAGFAARAAIWPSHFWLLRLFASSQPAVAILLGAVPVAIALLGIVRWLPVGEITSPDLGLIVQGLGVAAMLYAILAGIKRAQLKMLPAYVTIFATGLFAAVLGAGLSDSTVWNRYQHLIYFFIISVGFGVAVLTAAIGWLQARHHYLAAPVELADDSGTRFDRWAGAVVRWAMQIGFDTLPRWRTAWLAKAGRLRRTHRWQKELEGGESYLRRWRYAITLFLLLGILMVFVGISFPD